MEITHLDSGSHQSDGMCLLEAAAYLAGEPHTDHPQCVSRVVAAFGRAWNDALDDVDRDQILLPLLPDLLGTGPLTEAQEHELALECLDWYLRVMMPAWMDLVPALAEHAAALRAQPQYTDETAASFAPICRAARDAAGDVAWDAAAGDDARAAARAAARAVAWDAAGVAAAAGAAWPAAGVADWDAAWGAAGDALHLCITVDRLQQSAADLLRRLCARAREMRGEARGAFA